jgi:hypothetical protein
MKPKLASFISSVLVAMAAANVAGEHVVVIRTPESGIQPQVAMDERGTVHLIYYSGKPDAGNVFYVKRESGQNDFSKPIRVNWHEGSAVAMGTIRGAQLALGKNGRVHVVWDGMGTGASQVKVNGREVAPLLYTRLNDEGTAFEPERNMITLAAGLDGGSSVAADPKGNVYVFWHAPQPGNTNEESGRAVFVARSSDEGRSFQHETPVFDKPTGACPCCGMRAFADRSGALYVLFRSATDEVNRDAKLLVATQPGAKFVEVCSHPWKVNTCPMSSTTITQAGDGALAAWETAGEVYWCSIDGKNLRVSKPTSPPPGKAARKHPVAVVNGQGEMLVAWTENTGWGKGGSAAWQRFDKAGKPVGEIGKTEGLPPWSLVTACALPSGEFLVIY